MKQWLNTLRWKNLLIIWLSIFVVLIPHVDFLNFASYIEFILWGIICTSVAAIGNITNDMLDVKQDRENKKDNIFQKGRNRKTAFLIILILLFINAGAIFYAELKINFLVLSAASLLLLMVYNIILKKIALLGNITIALLTALVFIGMDLIVISRLIYFDFGFQNKHLELLACYAFILTLVREIIKDAEDRKGDSLAGFKTLANLLRDSSIAIIIIMITATLVTASYFIMNWRQLNFMNELITYALVAGTTGLLCSMLMFSKHPSKYIWATRIAKLGMIGCLISYLILSL